MTMIEADHLGRLFRQRVRLSQSNIAIIHQTAEGRQSLTWDEVNQRVLAFAQAIWDLGARPGDRVALSAENSLNWVCTDLALHLLGIVHVPIHASLTGYQAGYQMLHSSAKVVIVSGETQARKLAELTSSQWDELSESADSSIVELQKQIRLASFEPVKSSVFGGAFRQLCGGAPEDSKGVLEAIEPVLSGAKTSDLATILYTSGTTGEPKGVMLTHGNLTSNARAAVQQLGEREEDLRFNFLPLSHVFARTCDLYTWIVAGSRLELARSRETAVADLRSSGATILNTVPFFMERIYRYLADNQLLDSPTAARDLMGGNLRLVNSGGAALPHYLYDYFNEHGVPLYQGYGLSETSPIISCCGPGRDRRGSAGQAIPGIEVTITTEGEIATRGPHVMAGYYRNDLATREVIRNEWFHTGDLGKIDEDGFLFITGRKKEIIVLSNGKNISPALIEGLILRDPLVSQVAIFGDGHHCLTALVVPNFDRFKAEFGELSPCELLEQPPFKERFRQILTDRLTTLSPHEQIKAFALIARPFSIEEGEMTAKMSLRRAVIAEHFRQVIDGLRRERASLRNLDQG